MSNPKKTSPKEPAEGSESLEASEAAAAPEAAAPAPADAPDYYGQLLRLKAEFENYRKRVDRDKPQWERHGREQLLARMLPLYDVLVSAHEQVVRHGAELEKVGADSGDVRGLVQGLELIFKEFTELFEAEGVARIESVGRPYDFNLHEVLGQVETDEHPEGTVVEELQRGYTLGGKVLRAARVRTAKGKTA